jgi:hypothetical protein
VLPFDPAMARTIFRRYFGPNEAEWDPRFNDVLSGASGVEMVRITPETVVVRDQSYKVAGGPGNPDVAERGRG